MPPHVHSPALPAGIRLRALPPLLAAVLLGACAHAPQPRSPSVDPTAPLPAATPTQPLAGYGDATPGQATPASVPATPAGAPADAPAGTVAGAVTPAPVDAAEAAPGSTTGDAAGAAATPTAAEQDYAAIYGQDPYNPVADPTLPAPARVPESYDPWERYNRAMHRFNNAVDAAIARPLARAYVRVVPRPVRLGVSNFFNNLGQPVTAVNALLQGKPTQAAQALGRFVLNSTLGIGGIFDPASDARLPRPSEDFGQTLGIWGWERSRYVELPLFGPRTVRDVFGMAGDAPLSALRQVDADKIRIPLQGLQLVEVRTQLLATDSLRAGAADDYALVRDAWIQRRRYQIFGSQLEDGETALPEYLQDDNLPIVPASSMPVLPPGG